MLTSASYSLSPDKGVRAKPDTRSQFDVVKGMSLRKGAPTPKAVGRIRDEDRFAPSVVLGFSTVVVRYVALTLKASSLTKFIERRTEGER